MLLQTLYWSKNTGFSDILWVITGKPECSSSLSLWRGPMVPTTHFTNVTDRHLGYDKMGVQWSCGGRSVVVSCLLTYCTEGSKSVLKLAVWPLTEIQKENTCEPAVQDFFTNTRTKKMFWLIYKDIVLLCVNNKLGEFSEVVSGIFVHVWLTRDCPYIRWWTCPDTQVQIWRVLKGCVVFQSALKLSACMCRS